MRRRLVLALAGALVIAGMALPSTQAGSTEPVSFTSTQALEGAKTYAAQCSRCHGANLEGVSAPALRGSGSGLASINVSEAYKFISTQMPAGNPGGLTTAEYTNVLAYILSRNGHHPAATNLTPAIIQTSHAPI